MPPPDQPPKLRASDADRDAAAERLRDAAAEGRLDPLELDERLTRAFEARWCGELASLTSDVTPPAAPAAPAAPARSRMNPLAVASLVAGAVVVVWLASVAAIALGTAALWQIARSEGAQTGRALALAGIALGCFGVLRALVSAAGAVLL